jgi:hypothetical protein
MRTTITFDTSGPQRRVPPASRGKVVLFALLLGVTMFMAMTAEGCGAADLTGPTRETLAPRDTAADGGHPTIPAVRPARFLRPVGFTN